MTTIEFQSKYDQLSHMLNAFAYKLTQDKERAKDLYQETTFRALTYKNKFQTGTNFKAWVFTIMRNIFINQYRRKVKSGTIFDNSKELYLITNSKGHEQTPVSQIATKDIEEKIESLSSEYKEPFVLHFKGFKYKEIAEQLQIPIGTVKSRIFIARKKLIDLLPDYSYTLN